MCVVHRFSVPVAMQPDDPKPQKSLGFWRLLGLLYLVTCCGAYATEEMVRAGGGPFFYLIALATLPWLWGLPNALGVAELATAMPSNGGVLVWVNCAYHPVLTCTVAICSLLMNVIDTAIYPQICVDYLLEVIGDQPEWVGPVCKVTVIAVACLLNILGMEAVGTASTISMILCLAPFIALFAVGSPQLTPTRWLEHSPPSEVQWATLISMVTWNLSGFDAAGHVVEEIHESTKSFPRALVGCLFLTTLTFLLPVLVGTSVDQNYDQWHDGYWSVIADKVGGSWLRLAISAGGCCSGFGLLLSYLCTSARATAATATMGIYPHALHWLLGTLSGAGVPIGSVILMTGLTIVFSMGLGFKELVAVSSFFNAAQLLLMLVAIPILRYRYPTLPRPYRLPFGFYGVIMVLLFPVLFCGASLVACATVSRETLILGPGTVLLLTIFSTFYVKYCRPDGFGGRVVADDDDDDDDCDVEGSIAAALDGKLQAEGVLGTVLARALTINNADEAAEEVEPPQAFGI